VVCIRVWAIGRLQAAAAIDSTRTSARGGNHLRCSAAGGRACATAVLVCASRWLASWRNSLLFISPYIVYLYIVYSALHLFIFILLIFCRAVLRWHRRGERAGRDRIGGAGGLAGGRFPGTSGIHPPEGC